MYSILNFLTIFFLYNKSYILNNVMYYPAYYNILIIACKYTVLNSIKFNIISENNFLFRLQVIVVTTFKMHLKGIILCCF